MIPRELAALKVQTAAQPLAHKEILLYHQLPLRRPTPERTARRRTQRTAQRTTRRQTQRTARRRTQ